MKTFRLLLALSFVLSMHAASVVQAMEGRALAVEPPVADSFEGTAGAESSPMAKAAAAGASVVEDSLPQALVGASMLSEGAKYAEGADDECCICYEKFCESDKKRATTELSCEHTQFHRNCLMEWLDKNTTCPYCRDGKPTEDTSAELERIKRERIRENLLAYNAALLAAAIAGKFTDIHNLLAQGADVATARDATGQTAVHLAVNYNANPALVIALLRGLGDNTAAKVALLNVRGGPHMQTALHLAAKWSAIPTIKELLELGADSRIKDKHRKTPKDVARDMGHKEVVTLFTEHERRLWRTKSMWRRWFCWCS